MNELLLDSVRKRAPVGLDFEALVTSHQARNRAMIAEYRHSHQGAESAVLEITVPATGQTRRRLRHYAEFASAARNTPEVLILRSATTFNFIDLKTITVEAAAARAGAAISVVRLLSVSEALTPPP